MKMGNEGSRARRRRMSSDASIDSISDWYLVTPPRRQLVKKNDSNQHVSLKKKRSDVREGFVRVPVYVSPRRGADKMLGSFECDLRQNAFV